MSQATYQRARMNVIGPPRHCLGSVNQAVQHHQLRTLPFSSSNVFDRTSATTADTFDGYVFHETLAIARSASVWEDRTRLVLGWRNEVLYDQETFFRDHKRRGNDVRDLLRDLPVL